MSVAPGRFFEVFIDTAYEDGWYIMRTSDLDVHQDAADVGD
jgi:hypothetical protein